MRMVELECSCPIFVILLRGERLRLILLNKCGTILCTGYDVIIGVNLP